MAEPASASFSRNLRKRNRKTITEQYTSGSSEDDSLEDIEEGSDCCLKCSLCTKRFSTKKLLDAHMAKHGSEGHSCSVCGKVLTSKVSLQQHMTLHSGEKNFMCEQCGQRFRLKRFLRRHRLSHLPKAYQCDMCRRSFAFSSHLTLHQKKHGKRKYECDMCGDFFNKKSDLDKHLSVHDEGGDESDDSQGERRFPCSECRKSFKSSSLLEKHMQLHKTPDKVADELSGTHNQVTNKKSSSSLKQFECDQCGKHYSTRSSLGIHVKSVHSDVKKFTCVVCERAFARKYYLELHMAVHTGEKKYVCEECDKCFTQRSSLNTHMKSHKAILPTCPVCEKAFRKTILLVQHLEEHRQLNEIPDESLFTEGLLSGQVSVGSNKDLECPQCGKAYATKSSLTTHLNSVHSDVRKFQCGDCDRTFTRKCYLDVHRAIHTGEKKYVCKECGKCFAQKSTLNTHQNLHSSTHKCNECGKTFGRNSHLVQHLKQVHMEEKGKTKGANEIALCQEIVHSVLGS